MKRYLLLILCMFLSYQLQAQKSYGGSPALIPSDYAWKKIHLKTLSPLNTAALLAEDSLNDKNGSWPRVAQAQQTNISLENNGSWEFGMNGTYRIWQYKISTTDAKGLIISFNDFYLSPHTKMFIYDENQEHILGAFTHANNPDNGYFSVGILKGDNAIIEVREAIAETGQSSFTVYEVAQVYRLANPPQVYERDFGDSDPCQVNVNCSPEGDNWQDEKKGVARILLKDGLNWGWCSGSLVNNTAQDCTPYFLTAHHCGETSSATDRSQWIFYFNYESTGCSNGTNPIPFPFSPPSGSHTTSGCLQVSHSNDGGGVTGSDYKLLNLNNLSATDISSWGLYFNGWDASGTGAASGVGIHHPSGDIKKISTFTSALSTTQWNGNGLNSHWLVQWDTTTNGHGVTEGGSSGSPIFNPSGLIVGTLTGGSSYCATPLSPDMYGKMSYHWDQNTSPLGGHLHQTLDPVGNGSNTVLSGTYSPCSGSAPVCGLTTSTTNAIVGQVISFNDNSTNVPTSWSWDFGDSSPLDNSQNTTHAYSAIGTYTTTLIASNANGSCTTTVVINVTAGGTCDTLNLPPNGTLSIFTATGGYVGGSNAFNDLAKAQRFSSYTPYTHVSSALFLFAQATDGGNSAIVRFTVWDEVSGEPGTALSTIDIPLTVLDAAVPTGGNLIQVSFNGAVNVAGNPYYLGFEMINFGTGDTVGLVSNADGDPIISGQSWEMSSTSAWSSIDASWGIDIDFFISPLMTDQPPIGSIVVSDTSICEGDSIVFDASASTSIDSLLWILPNASPTNSTNSVHTAQYSSAGNEMAYLEVYGACRSFALDSIAITVNPEVSVSATATNETCTASDGTITAVGSGGSGSYMYSIDNGATTQASGSFSGLGTGTYLVSIYDSNGCYGTTTVSVGQDLTGPTTSFTGTPENCGNSDGTLVITATGAVDYSIDGGITSQSMDTFNGLTAGNYSVQVVDGNGCIGTTTAIVTANTAFPTISSSTTDENCGNGDGSITLNGAGGSGSYSYSIDNGTTFQSSGSFPGLSAGSFTAILSDSVGCSDTATVTVTNIPPATISSVTVTDVSCNGGLDGELAITATGGTLSYSIDNTTFQASNSFSGLGAGNYTVYVDNGACIVNDGPHVISEPTVLSLSITTVPTGCSNNTGEINAMVSGGTAPYTYSIDCGTTFQTSAGFTGLGAATYCVLVEDANGCTTSVSETVGTTMPLLISTVSENDTCNNSDASIMVIATGGDANYSYSINGGTSFQASNMFSGLTAGTYNVHAIDQGGCIDSTMVVITNTGSANISTNGNQTICEGESVTLTATGSPNIDWFIGTLPSGTGSSISVNPLVSTTYTVIGNDGICYDTTTVDVSVNATPTTSVSTDTSICSGGVAILSATGGTQYYWHHSGQTSSSVTVSPTTATAYMVTAYNGTCPGDSVQINVGILPGPSALANSNVTTTWLGSMGGQVTFDTTGSTGTSYSWDFGDGNGSSIPSPTHSYSTAGTYTVVLTATLGACVDHDTLIILVEDDLSINNPILENSIKAYPNPTSTTLFLAMDFNEQKTVTVTLTNALGQTIMQSEYHNVLHNTRTIDVRGYANGYYFLRFNVNDEQIVKKISITH